MGKKQKKKVEYNKFLIQDWWKKHARLVMVGQLVSELGRNWARHNNSSMAAAMAYRSLFAVIPLVLFLVMMARWLDGGGLVPHVLRGAMEQGIARLPLDRVMLALEQSMYMQNIRTEDLLGMIFVILVMIYGVSTVFRELIIALDNIWEEKRITGIRAAVRRRLMGMVAVIVVGTVLFFASMVSVLVVMVTQTWESSFYNLGYLDITLNYLLMPLMLGLLFGLLYLFVPPVKLKPKDIMWPTIVSTGLFMVGQELVRWYLRTADLAVYTGTVGGFVVFMVWVYYSAMIVLVGAETSKLYAERWGSHRPFLLTRWWKRFKRT